MRVEIGAAVLVYEGDGGHFHLVRGEGDTKALCGLRGLSSPFQGSLLERSCCSVCLARAPALVRAPVVRGGWTRRDRCRWTDAELEALYRAYVQERVSLRQLVEGGTWERKGYSTPIACSNALHKTLRARGYKLRSVSEALVLRNLRHGRAPRQRNDEGAYRRWFKETHELYRPRCKGVKRNSKGGGKGRRCLAHAMAGSDYCQAHAPERQEALRRNLAEARSRSPLTRRELVEWADVYELLEPWLAQHEYPKKALAQASGIAHAQVCHYLNGNTERLTVETARKLLRAAGIDPAALPPPAPGLPLRG